MKVKFKYFLVCINIMLIHFDTNFGFVISKYEVPSGDVRIRRQAGYVYDKPNVSFDLPTATSIATTQATTVDRTQMQMYYAYPVPASENTVNVAQQNTGSSAVSTSSALATSDANGYNYGVQNAQVTDTSTLTQTKNTASTGYQNTVVTGSQVSSGSGYGDGRPTAVSDTVSTSEIVSTSAPRYLPPTSSGQNTVVTITKPTDSYVPPSVQVSAPQNEQTVITQTATNAASAPANPNTGYLLPRPQPSPNISNQPVPVQPVPNVPTQQYLPPIESSGDQKIIQGPVSAPAATYLPPVF